jgi:hypothetical protein
MNAFVCRERILMLTKLVVNRYNTKISYISVSCEARPDRVRYNVVLTLNDSVTVYAGDLGADTALLFTERYFPCYPSVACVAYSKRR